VLIETGDEFVAMNNGNEVSRQLCESICRPRLSIVDAAYICTATNNRSGSQESSGKFANFTQIPNTMQYKQVILKINSSSRKLSCYIG